MLNAQPGSGGGGGPIAVRLDDKGAMHEAENEAHYRQLLARDPRNVRAMEKLTLYALEAKRFREAGHLSLQLIQINDKHAPYWNHLGIALHGVGQPVKALEALDRALSLRPNYVDAYINKGVALLESRRIQEAIAILEKVIALSPNDHRGHANLGSALLEQDRLDEALAAIDRGIALKANFFEAINNRGNVLKMMGRLDEAEQEYRKVIALNPKLAEGHWNLSVILLLKGDLEAGWQEYEWRVDGPRVRRYVNRPLWQGEPLNGQTILLTSEQGVGDCLQFVRYASIVARMNANVVVAAPQEVADLVKGVKGVGRVILERENLEGVSLYCPLMSLPRVLKTRRDSMPWDGPYLAADADKAAAWRSRIPTEGGKKVGLVWAGGAAHKEDHRRSMKLKVLAEGLADLSGLRFYSLQKGQPAEQACDFAGLIDWMDEVADFSDTAAIIDQLDLVIGVDTSVIHLAGAMGKPVWNLLQHVPDWRWQMAGITTGWYPTMRLFRQEKAGDWNPVVGQVRGELRKFLQQ